MTNYEKSAERPTSATYSGFDYIEFYVGNAKQAAAYYCIRFGFEEIAYKGLETGNREFASHVVRQNDCTFVFTSPLNPVESEMGTRIGLKGDAAKDVAFAVSDAKLIYEKAVSKGGAQSIRPPEELKDEHGSVIIASIKTYGDTVHTFVQRGGYNGTFLPGFKAVNKPEPVNKLISSPGLLYVDHVVGNQPDHKMESVCSFYEKCLDFHRFWSVDDKQVHTEYSSLRSIVMADYDEKVKMPINEPAAGKKKSQIQEYVDYHGEGGVQHIAIRSEDIIQSVKNLRSRGLEFLSVPKSYYDDVKKRLEKSPIKVAEDLQILEELQILIDFDDQGYLLQLFSKPQEDRPTLFYEIIQRRNHQGFGAGNFKALFESIEREQNLRGNF